MTMMVTPLVDVYRSNKSNGRKVEKIQSSMLADRS